MLPVVKGPSLLHDQNVCFIVGTICIFWVLPLSKIQMNPKLLHSSYM